MAEAAGEHVVHLHVQLEDVEDPEELSELTARLRNELLELDVTAVDPVSDDQAPPGAKGVAAVVGGWLVVHLGPAGLKALVDAVASWAGRTGKTVELTIGGDSLKLSGTSADVQERIVEEFFARQPRTDGPR